MVSRARRSLIVAGTALLTPGLAAASASAATLAVTKPCYIDTINSRGLLKGAPMTVTGTGYVPGAEVSVTSSDGSVNTQATADASGDIVATITAPTPVFLRPGSQIQTLTARDYTPSGVISAQTPVKDTELAVATFPAHAPPRTRVTWYLSGFRPGRIVYAHYLHRHRQVALARFGRARGVCGLLRVRARFFPGRSQRYRSYGLQIDDSRAYRRRSAPRIVTSLVTTPL